MLTMCNDESDAAEEMLSGHYRGLLPSQGTLHSLGALDQDGEVQKGDRSRFGSTIRFEQTGRALLVSSEEGENVLVRH